MPWLKVLGLPAFGGQTTTLYYLFAIVNRLFYYAYVTRDTLTGEDIGMPNINNPSGGALRLTRRKLLVSGALIVLIVIGVVLYQQHHKTSNRETPLEQRTSQTAQNFLNTKDYESYQTTQTTVANEYIVVKEYANAERVLNEIVAKVPSDKITSATYQSYWYLYKQKGDTQNRKKYALLAAKKFQQEGDAKTAALFEKDANTN
ncbi:MAG TPA: hypothetical protein VFH37_02995 [Candidatus Saccharimonadales bacterium]|nr:hypothetical protein [Candidatus Saccharimonadales bacterium]